MFDETKEELQRRQNIEKADQEIRSILNKYGLTMADFKGFAFTKSIVSGSQLALKLFPPAKRAVKSKIGNRSVTPKSALLRSNPDTKADKRSSVAAKYLNPTSKERWSGRGRAPSWVNDLCKKHSITITSLRQTHVLRCRI